GREVLLALVRDYDVLLESFRPGVLERLGVGYERMREENPGIVYCAISGYGQDSPKREASGHDMNYLGLVGLLGLTGERGGAPRRAARAALRERHGGGAGSSSPGAGAGQFVDVSMADGSLAWLAMVAASYFADGTVPHRGELPLPGALICYRPYECADGWVTLGALEPKFWQAFCRGVGREDLIERQFERPGSEAHAQVVGIFQGRTRAEWEAFAAANDCCLEPLLELDEALSSELVREREMVVEIEQPGAEGTVRQLGLAVKLARTPGEPSRMPGPALGEHTEAVLLEAGYSEAEVAELLQTGAAARAAEAEQGATFRV